jgi:hypothetical protein
MVRGRAAPGSRPLRPPTWLLGVAGTLGTLACGQPNPRILESSEAARGGVAATVEDVHSEPAKIRQLIALVRQSEHTFLMNGIERSGPATAQKLQVLLDRDVDGVRSALEFIERIAAPAREDELPDRVIIGPEEQQPTRAWFLARLAEIEGRPVAVPLAPREAATTEAALAVATRPAGKRSGNLQILDALLIIERSDLKFVAPPRKQVTFSSNAKRPGRPTATPKKKPKAKEYTSREFADMLRKKWEFLGADIHDLDAFIEEIASDSFATMEPYLVVHPDGTEEPFRVWLEATLAEREVLAAGGSP